MMISGKVVRYLWSILVFALSSHSVLACLNPIGQEYLSEPVYIEGLSGSGLVAKLQSHQDRAYWTDILNQIRDRKEDHSIAYEPTNHAVALAHLGRVKEAITILEELERKKPGQYATAANLGTAYELNGENEKALKWIKEGFRRNSEGHSGTEWLHVKILEAKIRMANESGTFEPNSVLDIRFDQRPELSGWYTTDHLGQRKSLKEIEEALAYQLHERLEFVKPPEPVVADLLADLSKVLALTREPADAEAVYELAKSYGTARPIYTRAILAATQAPVGDTDSVSSGSGGVVCLGLPVLVALGIALWLILTFRKRRRKSTFDGLLDEDPPKVE
jgi:tetratricopeptide (TPR) repeat protein